MGSKGDADLKFLPHFEERPGCNELIAHIIIILLLFDGASEKKSVC